MLLAQVFKTREGADKRAMFETAHSNFLYASVRCIGPDSAPDSAPFDAKKFKHYTWRIERLGRQRPL
jgi:hypothetical protein